MKNAYVKWKEILKNFAGDKPTMTKATARRTVVSQSWDDSGCGGFLEALCKHVFQSDLWPWVLSFKS